MKGIRINWNLVSVLWLGFAGLWIFAAQILGSIFDWIRGLPLALEVILWIVLLPWVGSLWIWHSSWPLWAKIVVIVVVALVTAGAPLGWKAGKKLRRPSRSVS
jgi:hypothetical protein